MRISLDEAREYWAHPSQQIMGATPENLPGDPFQYWAEGPVCTVFHPTFWPGVWMGHYAVKPEAWGHAVEPARRLMAAFWEAEAPSRIIGWTPASNRMALSFARRLGFVQDGAMPLNDETVIMQGWVP